MRFFKNMRLGTRLVTGFLTVVAMGGIVASVGVVGLSKVNELNGNLYERELLAISYVKEANINLVYAARARQAYALATDDAGREAAVASFKKASGDVMLWLDKAKPLFVRPEGIQKMTAVEEDFKRYVPTVEAYIKAAADKPHAAADPALIELDKAARAANQVVDDTLTGLTRLKEAQGKAAAEEGTQIYKNLSTLMIVLSVVSGVAGLVIGVILTRSVTRRLGGEPEAVAEVANAIAGGNLATQVDVSRAEPGSVVRAMFDMQQSLRNLVGQVRHSSESIATASGQIATGNQDLSQRTEEQASNLQQTAASMEQLTGTVKSNAETAQHASQLAGSASDVAVQGGEVVSKVVQTMDDISNASRKISEIIAVIDGIAFQTNILALNAAVEAARAGEQGRGFAVVAGEVRTLAQRSGQAAKEIKTLINDSVKKVEAGSRQVGDAGKTMEDIVTQVRRVADLIGEMSAATREQSSGISQVGTAVAQLDQVTQQNAALVEESAAAADSLSQQAQQLVQAVSVFRV